MNTGKRIVINAGPNGAGKTTSPAGLRNFETVYKSAVDDWALYDNAGDEPALLDWSEKP